MLCSNVSIVNILAEWQAGALTSTELSHLVLRSGSSLLSRIANAAIEAMAAKGDGQP
jgi:hypothetical protein